MTTYDRKQGRTDMPKLWVTMIIVGFAGAATAAPARPTIPIYDAQSLAKACADGLADASAMVKRLEAMPLGNAGSRDLLDRWDRLRIRLEDFEGPVDLTANVSPDAATRTAAEACESQTTRFETELYQNGALYARIKALTTRGGPAAKMRKDLLDTFEDNGVALAPDKRARLKAIADRLEAIRQEFDRDIRDNQTRVVFSPDEVSGLPQDYLDKAKRDDKGNYLLGFEYPEYLPFMANAENEDARRRYQFAFQNRGTPRNIELLAEAMRLRKEMAGLFGLSSYAEFATRRRMVDNPQTVDKFLRDVKSAVREVERKEIAELTRAEGGDLAQAGRRGHIAALGRRLLPGAAEEGALQRRPGSLAQVLSDRSEHPVGHGDFVPALRHPLRAGDRADLAPRRALFRRLRRGDRQAQGRHLHRSVSPRRQVQPRGGVAGARLGEALAPHADQRAGGQPRIRPDSPATSSRRWCTSSGT